MGLLDRIRLARPPKRPRDLDELALRHLVGRGADLALPRHVIHYVCFGDEADARAAAEAAHDAGWTVEVEEPQPAAATWTVRADGTRVVSAATVTSFRAWFESLAAEHGGEYEGWEAASKP